MNTPLDSLVSGMKVTVERKRREGAGQWEEKRKRGEEQQQRKKVKGREDGRKDL